MGCASSTEYVTDANGQEKQKKSLGGAYPGQRRPQHRPYTPAESEFGKDGTATAHFKAYGGGNALTLVQSDGSSHPQTGKPQEQFIQVTLPDGVSAGQTIHVQAPNGETNAIVVPEGFGPGSTFTVEFAPQHVTPPKGNIPQKQSPSAPTSAVQSATQSSLQDDGFASGFNNPGWKPTTTATAVAATEPDVEVDAVGDQDASGSYPTTAAHPVYTTTPVYPK